MEHENICSKPRTHVFAQKFLERTTAKGDLRARRHQHRQSSIYCFDARHRSTLRGSAEEARNQSLSVRKIGLAIASENRSRCPNFKSRAECLDQILTGPGLLIVKGLAGPRPRHGDAIADYMAGFRQKKTPLARHARLHASWLAS